MTRGLAPHRQSFFFLAVKFSHETLLRSARESEANILHIISNCESPLGLSALREQQAGRRKVVSLPSRKEEMKTSPCHYLTGTC